MRPLRRGSSKRFMRMLKKVTLVLWLPLWAAAGACSDLIDSSTGKGKPPTELPPAPGNCGPLRETTARLTARQYENTLAFVTGEPASKFSTLPKAVALNGNFFDNNIESLEISHDLVGSLSANADLAAIGLDVAKAAPCAHDSAAERKLCGAAFVRAFGEKAFRRPLSDAETQRYDTFLGDALDEFGYEAAVRLTARAMLQAPQFVYLIEETEPGEDEVETLTPYALASKLSYTLTQSPPDEALLTAAAEGALRDEKILREHAERLLNRGSAAGAVSDFFKGWLHIRAPDYERKLAAAANFTVEQNDSLPESLHRFAQDIFWEQGARVDKLLSSQRAFVNPPLAELWNTPIAGSDWQAVELDPKRHSGGLLTQPAWLAQLDPPKALYRGIFVARHLLCSSPPPPPEGIVQELGDENSRLNGKPLTDRQRLELLHAKGSCAGCHKVIDEPGFAFEHFDEVGRWRDLDNGQPIDASGVLEWSSDVDGPFADGLELAKRLARSSTVMDCVATQWFRFLHARSEDADDESDTCTLQEFSHTLRESKGDMHNLVLSILSSPSYRNRPSALKRPQ